MILNMLKSKIHRATVTQCELDYEGSITIDVSLMRKANILCHEQVEVYNITNGQRFSTYAIEGEEGSGVVCINGAAARLNCKNDLVIICAYASMNEEEAHNHDPTVVLIGENNKPKN